MPVREPIPQTRKERQNNAGSTAEQEGPGLSTLFAWDALESKSSVLYIQTTRFVIPAGNVGQADWRPFARVSWGHGGASVRTDYDITYRQRIPLAASDVNVQIFIKALPIPGGIAPPFVIPPGAIMRARGFLADGADAEPLFPTVWGTQLDVSSGVIADDAARLASLRAVNPGAFAYLLLFDADAVPAPGAVPVDVVPLPPAATSAIGPVALPLGQTRAFVNGIAWAMSSTPFVLTAVVNPIVLGFELES